LIVDISRAAGATPENAAILADSLVYANLIGVDSHGATRLAIYIKRIRAGLIDPAAQPEIKKTAPSVAVVNGKNAIGQVVGTRAMEKAIEMARETGVGLAAARHSQHFGTCSYYCNLVAQQDMIGIAFTNAEPAMVPWGAKKPYFGTNPIAMVCPTGLEFPIVIDLATSVTARGKIIAAAKKGEKIPLGWALDSEGNPTDDAQKALDGAVLTMAEHKGYALAFLIEVLTGVLSGAAFGFHVGSMYKDFSRTANVGHFLGAINIASFMNIAEFKERITTMIREIKSIEPAAGFSEVLVPGEIEHRNRTKRLKEGIPLPEEVVSELKNLAEELNVEFSLVEKGEA